MKEKIVFGLLGLFAFSGVAHALGSIQGTINTSIAGINANGTGVFTVGVTGTYQTPPSCAATGAASNRFVVTTETKAGKAIIATLLMAQAGGRGIGIQGWGTCNTAAGYEDIYYVYVN